MNKPLGFVALETDAEVLHPPPHLTAGRKTQMAEGESDSLSFLALSF